MNNFLTISSSSKRVNPIAWSSMILTAALSCTSVVAESVIPREDHVLASFERDLNREPGAIASASAHSPAEDPLHTQINVTLWNQESGRSGEDQVLASFKRDLKREPGAVAHTVAPDAAEDPLQVHVNMALWDQEPYDFSNNRLLAQANR